MEEIWKPITGYPQYRVSSLGRVWSERAGRVLAGGHTGKYATVILSPPRRTCYVHHLVAEAFIGPRPDGLQVRHRDDDNFNNSATNLIYGTPSENAYDRERARAAGHVPIRREWKTKRTQNTRRKNMAIKKKYGAAVPVQLTDDWKARVRTVADHERIQDSMAAVIRDCIEVALPGFELELGLRDLEDLTEGEVQALGLEKLPEEPRREDRARGSFGYREVMGQE